jgi:hypothetical protein
VTEATCTNAFAEAERCDEVARLDAPDAGQVVEDVATVGAPSADAQRGRGA